MTTSGIHINTWFGEVLNGYHEGYTLRAKDTNAAILDSRDYQVAWSNNHTYGEYNSLAT